MLPTLREDALMSTPTGFSLRLCLPWIRSLPLWSLEELQILIDGEPVDGLCAERGGRRLTFDELGEESEWWFLQEQLVITGERVLAAGAHEVEVSFFLRIPYMQAGPDGPLTLPFHDRGTLTMDAPATPPAVVAPRKTEHGDATTHPELPAHWTLAASSFNWMPEIIRADRPAADIVAGIVEGGTSSVIELEPGQLWPSFPDVASSEATGLGERLASAGGRVSIVGASLDDWLPDNSRRDDEQRLAFLLPQLRAAHAVGATGVRLPIGQAGEGLLRALVPTLHELDLVLFEEIQGQQTPDSPATAAAIDTIAGIDDARVRMLVDISMLMPALPHSYLDRLAAGGVPDDLLRRLREEWRDPAVNEQIVALLRSGSVPPEVHTLFMNLLVRFGRSRAADLRGVLPLVGTFHLKFWDLDDSEDFVSGPIRELGAELSGTDFAGTFCSEWGGHEWLDDDPAATTRAHLALARRALAAGAGAASAL